MNQFLEFLVNRREREALIHPETNTVTLDYPSRYRDLSCIWEENNEVHIGAGATREDIVASPIMNNFFSDLENTIGAGSYKVNDKQLPSVSREIALASPVSDLIIFLMALKSTVLLGIDTPSRNVPLKSFYKGRKKQDIEAGENIVGVQFARPDQHALVNFKKVSRRKVLDVTVCNSALYIEIKDGIIFEIFLSAGGVAPTPLFLIETCHYLLGRTIEAPIIREAAQVMQKEICPRNDERGAAQYKRLLMRQLLYAHFLELFPGKIKLKDLL